MCCTPKGWEFKQHTWVKSHGSPKMCFVTRVLRPHKWGLFCGYSLTFIIVIKVISGLSDLSCSISVLCWVGQDWKVSVLKTLISPTLVKNQNLLIVVSSQNLRCCFPLPLHLWLSAPFSLGCLASVFPTSFVFQWYKPALGAAFLPFATTCFQRQWLEKIMEEW